MYALRRHYSKMQHIDQQDLVQLADAWFDDGSAYSMADLTAYGKHISGEKRLTAEEREPEPTDISSPYWLALSEKEQKDAYKEARG